MTKPLSSIRYGHLDDFRGLPAIRNLIGLGDVGFHLTELPELPKQVGMADFRTSETAKFGNVEFTSAEIETVLTVIQALHKISHTIFKNISHAVELPWEKYLGEIHELSAPSKSKLRLVPEGQSIPIERSTLTIVINSSNVTEALILFGTALSVFTEGTTSKATTSTISTSLLPSTGPGQGQWIVYYVCPNEDVMYTRTAGALMTPLSSGEYETRKRVKDSVQGIES